MFIPYCPGTTSPQGLLDHFSCLTWWTAASGDSVHLNWWWAPSSPTSLPAQRPCLFFCDSEFAFWNLKSFQPGLSRHFPVFYYLLAPSPTTQNSPSTRGPQRLLLHCCGPELYSCLSGWSAWSPLLQSEACNAAAEEPWRFPVFPGSVVWSFWLKCHAVCESPF